MELDESSTLRRTWVCELVPNTAIQANARPKQRNLPRFYAVNSPVFSLGSIILSMYFDKYLTRMYTRMYTRTILAFRILQPSIHLLLRGQRYSFSPFPRNSQSPVPIDTKEYLLWRLSK